MKEHYDFYWKRLDNVGTYYASTTTNANPNIYRLSVKLKEKIKVAVLNQAVNDTLQTIPSFNVKLRKGFFWYYLERNFAKPVVKQDQYFPFTTINNFDNNYFLFKVTYFEKRINVDFSHILTDGTGALYFIETLVTNYLKIGHPRRVGQSIVIDTELLSKNEMVVDSFEKYSKSQLRKENRLILKEHNKKSYIIRGLKTDRDGSSVIVGTISVEQLKKLTKPRNVTITAYLATILVYSIYQNNYKYNKSKDPIVICIPVNLRNYFPSYSMNNFFTTIMIEVDFSEQDYSFDEILAIVSTKMKAELNDVILQQKFKLFVSLQQNIILRFVPLIIKDILLRSISTIFSEHNSTSTLSNLGIVKVDAEISEYIDKVDLIPYTDLTVPIKLGLCSFDDKLSIACSSAIADTEIEQGFFTYLSGAGVEVKIASSTTELDEGGLTK